MNYKLHFLAIRLFKAFLIKNGVYQDFLKCFKKYPQLRHKISDNYGMYLKAKELENLSVYLKLAPPHKFIGDAFIWMDADQELSWKNWGKLHKNWFKQLNDFLEATGNGKYAKAFDVTTHSYPDYKDFFF